VNHFNVTILSVIRCNMDIKFVGSGESAKAILYYITDYISKAQLKAHVAYAALELAIRKLGEYNPMDDEVMIRAKRMLQKCAHAMISHQELSSQQVMSYLLDLEDHFMSHQFNNLFWTTFEADINNEDPSPECYNVRVKDDETQTTVDDDREHTSEDGAEDVSHPTVEEPSLDDAVDHDEVAISVNDDDQIIAHPSQLTDYKHRAQQLDNLSLWDFCAQTEKINTTHESDFETTDINEILAYSGKKRPSYKFIDPHDEHHTHTLRIMHPDSQRVPVLIGSVPRRDQTETYMRYCRLMLILLKPWRNAFDLRRANELWTAAFDEFQHSALCPPEFKGIMVTCNYCMNAKTVVTITFENDDSEFD
jgi:hypothetical protein